MVSIHAQKAVENPENLDKHLKNLLKEKAHEAEA